MMQESRGTAIRLLDAAGNCLVVNDEYCRLTGRSCPDLVGKPFTVVYCAGEAGVQLEQFLGRLRAADFPAHAEAEYVLWDGRRVWFSENHLLFAASAESVYVLTMCRDITGSKTAENAVAAERNLLRTLIESTPDKIYIKDRQSRYVMNNTAHLRSIGLAMQADCIGKTSFDYFPRELAQGYFTDEQELLRTGEPLIGREEQVIDLSTGRTVWHLTTKVPCRDESGVIVGLVGISRDITNSKMLQEEREKLITELKDALAKIKRLNGLVPICAWCKKIREDTGYWSNLEQYIAEHSEATLSHGICPECSQKMK